MPFRFPALLCLVAMAVLAGPAAAAPQDAGVVALTPEARAAAIEAGAAHHLDGIGTGSDGRRIHGEAGIEIGSNGGRALYGTTVVPLGQTSTAAFSFLTAQGGRWRNR